MTTVGFVISNFTCKFFFIMFAFYASLSFIVPILYWLVSPSFEQIIKIPFYLSILAMMLVVLVNRFLLKDWFVLFCLAYMPFSLMVGLYLNPLGSAHFSHIFPYVLPVVGISFGYLVSKNFSFVLNKFVSMLPWLSVFLVITCVLYFILYKVGFLAYYGASSLLVLPFFFYFLNKRYFICLIIFFAIVLSGKRSDLLCLVLTLISYFLVKRPIYSLSLFLPCLSLVFFALYYYGFLGRFELIVDLLSNANYDLGLINEFSSNRLNDIIGAVESINKSPFFWLFGQGFGVTYTYNAITYNHTVHFTHFSPVSYVLLGGLVFCVAIYSKFISMFVRCLKGSTTVFKFYFVFLFFLSFLGGSIFFTNPFYWFVVGVVVFELNNQK